MAKGRKQRTSRKDLQTKQIEQKRAKLGIGDHNPFDRQKQNVRRRVLGQRVPTTRVSQSVAQSKRDKRMSKTISREFANMMKSGVFKDRRVDARAGDTGRQAAVRTRDIEQGLRQAAEGILTHKGVPLDAVEDAAIRASGFSDERETHIAPAPGSGADAGNAKTSDEVFSEIIQKSKFHRAQRKADAFEEQLEREVLDTEFATTIQPTLTPLDGDRARQLSEQIEVENAFGERGFERVVGDIALETQKARARNRLLTDAEYLRKQLEELQETSSSSDDMPPSKRPPGGDDSDVEADVNRLGPGAEAYDDELIPYRLDPAFAPEGSLDSSEVDTSDVSIMSSSDAPASAVRPAEALGEYSDVGSESDALPTGIDAIPRVVEAPQSLGDFEALANPLAPAEELVLLDRIAKSNSARVDAANKEKMRTFLCVLLDRVASLATGTWEANETQARIDAAARAIRFVCMDIPSDSAVVCRTRIQAIHSSMARRGSSNLPLMRQELLQLRLFFVAWRPPCSDGSDALFSGPKPVEHHPVLTPAILVLADAARVCEPKGMEDVPAALLLAQILLSAANLGRVFIAGLAGLLTRTSAAISDAEAHASLDAAETPCLSMSLVPSGSGDAPVLPAHARVAAASALGRCVLGFVALYGAPGNQHLDVFPELVDALLAALTRLLEGVDAPNAELDAAARALRSSVARIRRSRRALALLPQRLPDIRLLEPNFDPLFHPTRGGVSQHPSAQGRRDRAERQRTRREERHTIKEGKRRGEAIALALQDRERKRREEQSTRYREILKTLERDAATYNKMDRMSAAMKLDARKERRGAK
eukprot:gnl/Chilomastix_cuspidata/905.p1 GENE.gnl/Chilomastix_cuspidata/905~~gnl/Chilomastix_cuspidata/905.p1  ORF type:complete len:821 (-),score=222.37 gnl/Chilomastix_cuspidata/905:1298-3760(-)